MVEEFNEKLGAHKSKKNERKTRGTDCESQMIDTEWKHQKLFAEKEKKYAKFKHFLEVLFLVKLRYTLENSKYRVHPIFYQDKIQLLDKYFCFSQFFIIFSAVFLCDCV